MTTISLRVTGVDKLMVGFGRYVQAVAPVTREATYAALERASKVSPGYLGGNSYTTPPPPKSAYERTGNLGRSLQLEQDGLSARLSVNAYSKNGQQYGTYVLGDAYGEGQAAVHAGRWPMLRKAIDDEISKLVANDGPADRAIAALIESAGL